MKITVATCASFIAVLSITPRAWAAAPDYSAYYLYFGEDPVSADPAWGGLDTQGFAHTDSHWFITQKGYWAAPTVWRIPVEYDLGDVQINTAGVTTRTIPSNLYTQGFRWFGDPCTHRIDGIDYLLVPMGSDLFVPQWYRLAVFRADAGMAFVTAAPFGGSPWCSVDSNGKLYGSDPTNVSTWREYSVNWQQLVQSGTLAVQQTGTGTLYREDGVTVEQLPFLKGAEVTSDGRLLYSLVDQFHVFDASSGRRVRRSVEGSGPFRLDLGEFDFAQGFGIWDLEGTASPHPG